MDYLEQLQKALGKVKIEPEPGWSGRAMKRLAHDERETMCSVPCKLGGDKAHIYNFGPEELAYTGTGTRLRAKLLNIGRVRSHQAGDDEFTVVFPVQVAKAVAKVVRAKRVKQMSAAQLEALRQGRGALEKRGQNGPNFDERPNRGLGSETGSDNA